ncbi:MAG: hypothetical protein Q8N90_04130 [bacterium]|nr:hypothetical protein [bacterium]
MKTNDAEDLANIVGRIQSGNFSSIELRALFSILRYESPKLEAIFDIACFVAHKDERDQGATFDYIKSFVDKYSEVSIRGGKLNFRIPLFTQIEVVGQLYEVLETNNVPGLNKELFVSQSYKIMYEILKIVANTKIRYQNSDVQNCRLSPILEQKDGFGVFYVFEPIDSPAKKIHAKTINILAFYAQRST